MHLAVEAHIVAVFIAEQIGREEGVIEAGVEDPALIRGAAFYRDAAKQLAPALARLGMNPVEIPPRNLLVEIGERAGFAHKRNAHLENHLMFVAEVEPGAGVLALRRLAVADDRIVLP